MPTSRLSAKYNFLCADQRGQGVVAGMLFRLPNLEARAVAGAELGADRWVGAPCLRQQIGDKLWLNKSLLSRRSTHYLPNMHPDNFKGVSIPKLYSVFLVSGGVRAGVFWV